MMEKIRKLWEKHRSVLLYVFFGGLTTVVDFAVCFILYSFDLHIPITETLDIYTRVADVIGWVCAVLFAFFTNRAFVFSEGREGSIPRQLVVFAGGRVVSFGLDVIVTYFGALLLSLAFPALSAVIFIGREWNVNEILAKVVAAVIVIILNYFFSKFLVFRKKRGK